MNLADFVLPTRVVKPWPALDIGLLAGQRWWAPMFFTWLIPAATVLLVLNLALLRHPYIAVFMVWWLKPFWDRLPLYYLSRAIFADPPSVRTSLRSLGRVYRHDWLPWLLWRRFQFARSFVMPVTVLETQKSEARARRINVLQNNNSFAAYALTLTLMHLEALLPVAIIGVLLMFLPQWQDVDYWGLLGWYQQHPAVIWLLCWLALLGMAAIAPFYVAGGFMLYLHRRIELEGWDIEIGFLQTAQRQQKLITPVLCAAVLCCLPMLTPAPAFADAVEAPVSLQPPSQDATPAAQARQRVADVLRGEHFENKKTIHYWRKKDRARQQPNGFTEWLASWIGENWQGLSPETLAQLALLFEALLWLLLATVLCLLIYRFRQPLGLAGKARDQPPRHKDHPPQSLFGLQVEPGSLPENVSEQAKLLLEQENIKEAVGLLYRATISHLIHEDNLPIKKHFTELECQAFVSETLARSPRADYFRNLTALWLQSVYAHRPPENRDIYPLCNSWQAIFGNNSAVGEGAVRE